MADAGTLWRRATASMVSPRPTVMAVPPSQLHCSAGLRGGGGGAVAGGGGDGCTEPVMSVGDEDPGVYDAMPRPPPENPVVAEPGAGGGSWFVSTRPTGAGVTEPVTSPGLGPEELSLKRPESLLHPAAPTAIIANAIACGRARKRSTSPTHNMTCSPERNTTIGELIGSG